MSTMLEADVAIVGAGFSGTMLAVHLARNSGGALRVALIERGAEPGLGVAYGTRDSRHLLNVRAGQMGAFPDQLDGFLHWLRAHPDLAGPDPKPEQFMPRMLYGRYVQHILRQTRKAFSSLTVLQAGMTGARPDNGGYVLIGAEGPAVRASQVVLALGNFPPGEDRSGSANPYAPETLARLADDGDVFLIGAGLTSLDLLATIARDKRRGVVHVLSRNGMFPQVHRLTLPVPCPLDADNLPRTAGALLAVVRKAVRHSAVQDSDWRSVVDALRPLNQAVWQALPLAEQRRFLRRIRPYWETHRHRCAPDIMAAADQLRAQGRLLQHRGAFILMRAVPDGVAVRWRPAGGAEPLETVVQCAVNCTGPQPDIRKLHDPLVRDLLRQDLLTPDALGLGVACNADGAVCDSHGKTVPGLFTIGSWRKGRLYESVAVPELRQQAAALAGMIGQSIAVRS